MTYGQMQTEFYARGWDFLNQDSAGQTRAKNWLNEAYLEDVAEPYPWADLEATTTGTAPLTVSDLRDVIHVIDSTNDRQLNFYDSRDITDLDVDYATTTGTAEHWYFTDEQTLAVYPNDTTSTLSVRYFKVPASLSADGDTPVLPSRVHPVIVDFAVVRAYRDTDEWDAAERAQAHAQARLQKLADSILYRTSDPGRVAMTAGSLDQ